MPNGVLAPDERQRRKSRNRKIVVGFFIFIGLIVVLESPLTRIRHVDVSGNTTIQSSSVVKATGLRLGQSIWQVHPRAVSRRVLAAEPMAQRVAVHTDVLTGTVQLDIQERHIVAVYEYSGKFYELLNNGYPYQSISPTSGLAFPVITSNDIPAQPAQLVNSEVGDLCVQLAKLSAAETSSISEFHVNGDGTVSLYLDSGFVVIADISSLQGSVNAMQSAVAYFTQKGYKPGTIDLSGQPPYRYTPFVNAPAKNQSAGNSPTVTSPSNTSSTSPSTTQVTPSNQSTSTGTTGTTPSPTSGSTPSSTNSSSSTRGPSGSSKTVPTQEPSYTPNGGNGT